MTQVTAERAQARAEMTCGSEDERKKEHQEYFVFEIDFMVKLLRACVWMPRRN